MSTRRRLHVVAAALALLALSALDPALPFGRVPRCRLLLLDFSASARPFAAERAARARAWAAGLEPGDRIGWIGFGETAFVGEPLRPATEALRQEPRPEVAFGEGESRPAAAVELGLSLAPDGGVLELVLITDARATGPGTEAALRRARARGAVVQMVPLGTGGFLDVSVTAVRGPARVPRGEVAGFEAVVAAGGPCVVAVEWTVDGRAVHRERIDFAGAGEQAARLTLEGSDAAERLVRCVATCPAEPPAVQFNNESGRLVRPPEARPALWITAREAGASAAAWAAALPDLALTVAPAAGDFEPCDAVVLEDVPLAALGPATTARLAGHLRRGAGLVVLGGRHSFAAGEYAGSALEDLLPLLSTPRQTLALALGLDVSGSMGEPGLPGRTKLESSVQAAAAALTILGEDDEAGVIAFARVPETVRARARFDGVQALSARLAALRPGGETRLLTAVRAAAAALEGASGRRHILLLTDGQSPESTREFEEEAARLEAAGITLTAVAIGRAVGEEDLARLRLLAGAAQAADGGGGRAFHLADLAALEPALREDLTRQKGLFQETAAGAAATPGSAWAPDLSRAGPVGGWVRTRARDEARVDVSAAGEPLAASWQVGRGRVVALATDPAGAWGRGWQASGDAARVVAAAIRWALPSAPTGGVALEAFEEAGHAVLTVRVDDGGDPGALLDLAAEWTAAGETGVRRVPLEPVTPRVRRARVPLRETGPFRWTVTRGEIWVGTEAAYGSQTPERLRVGADLATAADWAAAGGGTVCLDAPPPAPATARGGHSGVPLRRGLQGLALLLLFVPPATAWWQRRREGAAARAETGAPDGEPASSSGSAGKNAGA